MELIYQIVRSAKRKKLTISVERDRTVVVHAPTALSDAVIQKIVDSKRQWLFEKTRHPQKYETLPHAPGKELVNGESMFYLGREYRVELTDSSDGHVRFFRKFLIPKGLADESYSLVKEWYMKRAKEVILPRVYRYAHDLGVDFHEAKIVDNRFRWGSCTTKDNVHLNWRLIKAPMFVIDYVIVHELAHLIEANHTPRFWNIVKAKAARAEEARIWLREKGQWLESRI